MKTPPRRKIERVFARLRHSSRIEHKQKTVKFVQTPSTGALPCDPGIKLDDHVADLVIIAEHIQAGTGVPEKYYRSSRGKDYLLDEKGWLHLHLADDVLLLCEQTVDTVVFISLVTHSIFDERPRAGSMARYQSQINALKRPKVPRKAPPRSKGES